MTGDEVLNTNFAEKLRARAENRVPVIVYAADPGNTTSQEAIDARYRAKLVARSGKSEPVAAASEPAQAPAPQSEAAELAALEEATRPDGDKPSRRK